MGLRDTFLKNRLQMESSSLLSSSHDFKVFINSYHPLIVVETPEEKRVLRLLSSAALQLGMELEKWTSASGIKNKHQTSQILDTNNPSGLFSYMKRREGEVVYLLKDLHCFLDDPVLVRKFRELLYQFRQTRSSIFLTGLDIKLPPEIQSSALFYELKKPSQAELKKLLESMRFSLQEKHKTAYQITSQQEKLLLQALKGMTIDQARQAIAYAFLDDKALTAKDIPHILKKKARIINEGGLLEFIPVSENRFLLGGFKNLKSWLKKAQVGFTEEAKKFNLPFPKGILMVGVPGCGKSLAAKVTAKMWGLPLLKLDAGRIYDKYIGESEKNFRKCVKIAESLAPSVLWIDEIEKALPSAGNKGSSNGGGLSQRLFGAFLTWLQEKKNPVFVVATANQIESLPSELLRKGRFDEIFFIDLPLESAREEIFKIHLTHRNLNPSNYEIKDLATQSEGLSGAEIEQSVLASLYQSLHNKIAHNTALILEEIKNSPPLSRSKKEFIEQLRRQYKTRFINAD